MRLENQSRILPIDRLEQMEVDLDGVMTYANFEVIDILDDKDPILHYWESIGLFTTMLP